MQEIALNFAGLALTPYSDVSPDGQLSACIGLESHSGALRPSLLTGKEYLPPSGDSGYELIHVHTTSAFSHFIFRNGNGVYWAEVSEGHYSPQSLRFFDGLKSVNTVGNTLVVLASDGMHYLLWKDSGYRYIGQNPPEISLSFGLSSSVYDRRPDTDPTTITPTLYQDVFSKQILVSDTDGQWQLVTDAVWRAINMSIEACTENNRFCMPFFVRAAYRRYDGSYTMLTSPVLMIPDSTGPKAFFQLIRGSGKTYAGYVYGRSLASILLASIPSGFASEVQSWSDIVSSLDIFISPQVMRADSTSPVNVLYGERENDLTWHKPPYSYSISSSGDNLFTKKDFDWQLSGTNIKYFKIPMKDEEVFLQDLNGGLHFYKVRSISLSQISSISSGSFFPVLEKGANLFNLTQLESLPDSADYQSHDLLIPHRSHVYNQRLHLFDVERDLFKGFLPENSWAYTNDRTKGSVTVCVFIASEDGLTRVVKTVSGDVGLSQLGRFLYYPDINATRMIVSGNGFSHDIPLQPHPFLNGAYYLFIDTDPPSVSVSVPSGSPSLVKSPNKIYTSEVGNPFYFPLEGIYTVGSGQIYGLSSIATALSQGQFGQFPLMVFCSDGNYAMSVNEEGRYSAIHPMQRDVCINPDAITQIDSEVVFITSKGVMITSGTHANNHSGILEGVQEKIPDELGFSNPDERPLSFFKRCRIAYDYTNRRIIFFSVEDELSYVYSTGEDSWSMSCFGPVKASINQFPYSYVQLADGTIYLLSDSYPYEGPAVKGLVYTRPVKMGTLQLKRLLRFKLQGVFTRPQKISVYGSNDCKNWHMVGQSSSSSVSGLSGRTFKYYRFAVLTDLDPSENISMLRIQFEPRVERRFR